MRKVWCYAAELPDGGFGGVTGPHAGDIDAITGARPIPWRETEWWFREMYEIGAFIRSFASREEYDAWFAGTKETPDATR